MSNFRRHEVEARNGGAHGVMNSTTAVSIVPSPASGLSRVVKDLRFINLDTAAATIRVKKEDGVSPIEFDNAVALVAGGKFFPVVLGDVVHLSEGESISAVLDGAVTTNQPTFCASWTDVPVPA